MKGRLIEAKKIIQAAIESSVEGNKLTNDRFNVAMRANFGPKILETWTKKEITNRTECAVSNWIYLF